MSTLSEKELFLQALDRETAERPRFLAEACPDRPEVRQRVEALLQAHDHAHTVLAGREAWTASAPDLAPGDQVGDYRLVSSLGEGGFGTVFLAEQERPVRRKVAFKVLKLGMDSRTVLARFDAERQALAVLDHPNIAQIFDAGTTGLGRPYFVMEFVDGVPITDYCTRAGLGVEGRLRIFAAVCLAIQHAHQKGIIHRDIKPSNVMVMDVDGQGVPKVIDFGIAKALESPLTEMTLQTMEGHLMGTPSYMSPEQAHGNAAVDTRSDVYSLGALLYELLCGHPPFDGEQFSGADVLDVLRTIREVDPPTPSKRRRRNTRTGTLPAGSSPGEASAELDWIVMRCLEKDPERRYATAWALARDIERYLNHEAVEAAPPSFFYRVRKLARRHRAASLAVVGVFLALLLGVVGTAYGLIRSRRSQAEALASEQEARSERTKVMRLSAFQNLRELESESLALWPADPGHIAAYERWLGRAEALVATLEPNEQAGDPGHHAQLEELRARAVAGPAQDGQGEWRFDSDEDSWWHAQLTQLVAEIEAFADPERGLLTGISPRWGWGVGRRLDFARSVEQRTLTGDEALFRWDVAREEIAASELYGGLDLEPQLGLLPLGQDVDSGLFEFAHVQSGDVPVRDDFGVLQIDGQSAIVFVLIPGGSYQRGAQADDPDGPNYDPAVEDDEKPVHEVRLDPFFLSKYEMTQGQWERFAGENPSRYVVGMNFGPVMIDGAHPIEHVTWYECRELLARMGLALPSEAQWERAARAGTQSPWFTGDKASLAGAANLADQAALRAGGRWAAIADWPEFDDGFGAHAPVFALAPNPFGLHGVHGNVAEWCEDGYRTFYPKGPLENPLVDPSDSRMVVNRGGSFALTAWQARSANRDRINPDAREGSMGVRPARPVL